MSPVDPRHPRRSIRIPMLVEIMPPGPPRRCRQSCWWTGRDLRPAGWPRGWLARQRRSPLSPSRRQIVPWVEIQSSSCPPWSLFPRRSWGRTRLSWTFCWLGRFGESEPPVRRGAWRDVKELVTKTSQNKTMYNNYILLILLFICFIRRFLS